MAQFRKRPVVIEAVQLEEERVIDTLEGKMLGQPGDWLITGVKGEQYPCKDEIFRETYEPVAEGEAGQEPQAAPEAYVGAMVLALLRSEAMLGAIEIADRRCYGEGYHVYSPYGADSAEDHYYGDTLVAALEAALEAQPETAQQGRPPAALAFLMELAALYKRHGMYLWACSCCEGVNLFSTEDRLAELISWDTEGQTLRFSLVAGDSYRWGQIAGGVIQVDKEGRCGS